MTNRRTLALRALGRALKLRKELDISLSEAACPFDVARRIGIEVRHVELPSAEGFYVPGEHPNIIISSLRPAGRKAFTCGHELGHHVFVHGSTFDTIDNELMETHQDHSVSDQEFLADLFSAFLLMPKTTVVGGMEKRGIIESRITELDILKLSAWLGVGYETFLVHASRNLGVISRQQHAELGRSSPKQVRKAFLGFDTPSLCIVDEHWQGRAVDLEVGDILVGPIGLEVEGAELELLETSKRGPVLVAANPGIGRVSVGSWSSFVRVCRRNFVGRDLFRFEPEVEDEGAVGD